MKGNKELTAKLAGIDLSPEPRVYKGSDDLAETYEHSFFKWKPEPITQEERGEYGDFLFGKENRFENRIETRDVPNRDNIDPDGAEERKATPIFSGFLMYFPKASQAVAQLSLIGNEQHHPGTPLHWDRKKSTDEADALIRHQMGVGGFDLDGVRHATKVAWRAMAQLEKELESAQAEAIPVGTTGHGKGPAS